MGPEVLVEVRGQPTVTEVTEPLPVRAAEVEGKQILADTEVQGLQGRSGMAQRVQQPD